MSTVLRVKRRAEESPQEALVLLSKRLKTEPLDEKENSELALNVFLLSGTVSEQKNTNAHLKKILSKTDTRKQELNTVKNAKEIIEKMRRERKEVTDSSRYEILNLSRGLNDNQNGDDIEYSLVDVAKTSTVETGVQYAYDLYYSQGKDFDVSTLDDVVRIEDLESELMFGSHRDNGRRTPSDASSVSSEDSNDENNWRNEYPDTEGSSIGEEDMRKAVEDIDIGNDLSSDADEDEIYNEPSVDMTELNTQDVQRYGLAYAKYKARVLAGETSVEDKKNLLFCTKAEDSDESSEGYKDDDDGFYYGMEEDTDQFAAQYRDSDDDMPD